MTKYYTRLILLFVLAQVSFIAFSQTPKKKTANVYYPAAGKWEHRSAAESGMDSVLLQQAVQFAKEVNRKNRAI